MADYGDYDSNEEEDVDDSDLTTNISITEVCRVETTSTIPNTGGRVSPESRKKQQAEEIELESPTELKTLLERIKVLENANKDRVLNGLR